MIGYELDLAKFQELVTTGECEMDDICVSLSGDVYSLIGEVCGVFECGGSVADAVEVIENEVQKD